jgi:aryl-alcohol dehydrogenase-like predicted oxidoreductase
VHVVATRPGWEDRDRGRLSYRHVVGNAEAALRRLDADWIDFYQLHAPDFTTPWEETLRALDDLVSRGLVRYLGWSNHPAWHAARGQGIAQQCGYAPFVSAQIYYSLVAGMPSSEMLPYCQAAALAGFLTASTTVRTRPARVAAGTRSRSRRST